MCLLFLKLFNPLLTFHKFKLWKIKKLNKLLKRQKLKKILLNSKKRLRKLRHNWKRQQKLQRLLKQISIRPNKKLIKCLNNSEKIALNSRKHRKLKKQLPRHWLKLKLTKKLLNLISKLHLNLFKLHNQSCLKHNLHHQVHNHHPHLQNQQNHHP